jgi:hypothetical protein
MTILTTEDGLLLTTEDGRLISISPWNTVIPDDEFWVPFERPTSLVVRFLEDGETLRLTEDGIVRILERGDDIWTEQFPHATTWTPL